ncbi:MAG TPA: HNH endonuclease [Stellaceae bacterium]|jgi:hypothetical protein
MSLPLTMERLRHCLDYDPGSGEFRWKRPNTNRLKPGDRAGTVDGKGHIQMRLDGVQYSGHRLAWFWVHGEWPTAEIDHKDRDRANNRIDNLRQATKSQNRMNTVAFANNKSGFKGVHPSGGNSKKPWRATINRGGARLNLGRFATAQEAHSAYLTAANRLFGEYASPA